MEDNTLKCSGEELHYFDLLKLFNDDYDFFVDALVDLGKCKLKRPHILEVVEDIRFYPDGKRKRNYHKIKESVDNMLDLPIDRLRGYKQTQSMNLFGEREEHYTDNLFCEKEK